MSKIDDGGQAFPMSAHPEHGYGPGESVHQGMSLRDYFAGIALPSLMNGPNKLRNEDAAHWAYVQADAMLAARSMK